MKEEKISYLIKIENEKGENLIWGFDNMEQIVSKVDELKNSTFWKETKSKITITKEVIIKEVLESILV